MPCSRVPNGAATAPPARTEGDHRQLNHDVGLPTHVVTLLPQIVTCWQATGRSGQSPAVKYHDGLKICRPLPLTELSPTSRHSGTGIARGLLGGRSAKRSGGCPTRCTLQTALPETRLYSAARGGVAALTGQGHRHKLQQGFHRMKRDQTSATGRPVSSSQYARSRASHGPRCR